MFKIYYILEVSFGKDKGEKVKTKHLLYYSVIKIKYSKFQEKRARAKKERRSNQTYKKHI
jgi:hypothetical protein